MSYNTMEFEGIVDRWVDGDTVDVLVDLGFSTYSRQRIRLYGVDTPERGQPGFKEATQLSELLASPGASVELSVHGKDKYGRWVADVISTRTQINIGRQLIEQNLGKTFMVN